MNCYHYEGIREKWSSNLFQIDNTLIDIEINATLDLIIDISQT